MPKVDKNGKPLPPSVIQLASKLGSGYLHKAIDEILKEKKKIKDALKKAGN